MHLQVNWIGELFDTAVIMNDIFHIIPCTSRRLKGLIEIATWALDKYGDIPITMCGQYYEDLQVFVKEMDGRIHFDIGVKSVKEE